MDNKIIRKSNKLINASYYPNSLSQMRFLSAILAQIDAGKMIDKSQIFEVTVKDMSNLFGTKNKTNYLTLKQAVKDLNGAVIRINRIGQKKTSEETKQQIYIVKKCEYLGNKAILQFTPQIIPHISNLKTDFTEYSIKQIIKIKSIYGIRLYELFLFHIKNKSEKNISEFQIEDLKQILGIKDKYRKFRNFKEIVIEPAIKNINEWSDLKVKTFYPRLLTPYKKIEFKINKKNDKKLNHK